MQPPAGDPDAQELATPEGAMRAWLARLCPFSPRSAFGASEELARAAMTDNGWATLNPFDGDQRDQQARLSWEKTVAAGESGRCAEPVAQVSPGAPRSAGAVIVIGTVTRVITPGAYTEQMSHARVVRRGPDGLWRVALPVEGG